MLRATTVCRPADKAVGVKLQTPLASAVAVPSATVPSVSDTVAFGAAVPVNAGLSVFCVRLKTAPAPVGPPAEAVPSSTPVASAIRPPRGFAPFALVKFATTVGVLA